MEATQTPTIRAEHIGSLLRPPDVREAMQRFFFGDMSNEDLAAVQQQAITAALARQEACGLPVVTDGEFHRWVFMDSFAEVEGMGEWLKADRARAIDPTEQSGRGDDPSAQRAPVEGRIRLIRNGPLEEYLLARELTVKPLKVTILSCNQILQKLDYSGPESPYATREELLTDIVSAQREIVRGLLDAGCRYIQVDGPFYTRFVDQVALQRMQQEGRDPKRALAEAIAADNAVIDGFHEAVFGLHLCRGNRAGLWHREGAYDAVAEELFSTLSHDRLLLEYDSVRAGGFEPLRFLPDDKVAVLGIVSTKTAQIEGREELLKRMDEAANFAAIKQLALSPQCGFASVLAGNPLSVEDQWEKLEVIVETATEIWGTVGALD
jgi:5-methyltetrahydropteroyltriglutamate--homocysteine methyltransferase